MFKRVLSAILIVALVLTAIPVRAAELLLPAPRVMVSLSAAFTPPLLKGVKVYSDNPFRLDFILDKGDTSVGADLVSARQSKDNVSHDAKASTHYPS